MTADHLWGELSADNLVEGERPKEEHPPSPWYVRVMLGIAGWIGALFLLLFVGVGFWFVMDNAAAAAIVGALCCAAAWAMFARFDGQDFVEQFALVISLVGQVMLVFALGQMLKIEDPPFFLAIAATQAVLALAIPNFLHRVLATGGAAVALSLAVNQMSLHGLAAPLLCAGLAIVWLEPRRWAASGRIWRPIGYGFVLALLLVETFRLLGAELLFGMANKHRGWFALHGPLLGRTLTAAVLVWVAIKLARREAGPAANRTVLLAVGVAILLALVSLNAPGLGSALLILLLGFSVGNRILIAIGILSLLSFATHFYYSLHATLLEKSGLLAVTGLCLLAAHFALRRSFLRTTIAEADHA